MDGSIDGSIGRPVVRCGVARRGASCRGTTRDRNGEKGREREKERATCTGGDGEREAKRGESGREGGRERERERERKRERGGERERGREKARASWERECDLRPVSRLVSDWCCVRRSRESTACALRAGTRPGGHVTRSPAGGRTASSPAVPSLPPTVPRCMRRRACLCDLRASVERACGPHYDRWPVTPSPRRRERPPSSRLLRSRLRLPTERNLRAPYPKTTTSDRLVQNRKNRN